MKTIKTRLLKQSIINLAVVALLSLLTACGTTASPNVATQTAASTGPGVTRDYARDLGVPDYLGASHGSGIMGR
jgi:hypothetical protein